MTVYVFSGEISMRSISDLDEEVIRLNRDPFQGAERELGGVEVSLDSAQACEENVVSGRDGGAPVQIEPVSQRPDRSHIFAFDFDEIPNGHFVKH